MQLVIIGGGYAGLVAALGVRQARPDAAITIVDPRPAHLKLTRLQQTLRGPLEDLKVPFDALGVRFDWRHIAAAIDTSPQRLADWQRSRTLTLAGTRLSFDYMLVATGSQTVKLKLAAAHDCYDLDDFVRAGGRELLFDFLVERAVAPAVAPVITVVGAGATGIQFLFELASDPKLRACRLRLVDTEPTTLGALPAAFDRYVRARLAHAKIDYWPNAALIGHEQGQAVVKKIPSGDERRLPSALGLLFPGRRPDPYPLRANAYGQVMVDGLALDNIFAAGDCARFASDGLNSLSAQAAVHKGKAVAANIVAHREGRAQRPYDYRERGYFVSMGALDGVGWLGNKQVIVQGPAALAIKTAVEAQHDLLLGGIDTYFGRRA